MLKATSKKSGKEFEVLEQTEMTVIIKSIVTGEEREIKQTTFARGYTVEEIEEEVERVSLEEASVEVEIHVQDETEKIFIQQFEMAGNAVEQQIIATLEEGYMELPQPFGGDIAELLRIRDNARQCYKENENKFRRLSEYKLCVEEKITNDCKNKFLAEEHTSVEKDLSKYVEKMLNHYAKYQVAKMQVEDMKALAQAEEDAEVNAEVEAE